MHDFRKLNVYKKALLYTKTIRSISSSFPKDELYALTSQYRRSADSIALNIAEGSGNDSKREFNKFLSYSIIKETNEIISMLIGLKRSIEK